MKNIFIFTIGYACPVKNYIKHYLGLNLFTSPFDWNIIEDISQIQKLFENNFKNYVPIESFHSPETLKKHNYTNKNHLTIINNYYRIRFMHENISDSNDNIYFYDIDKIVDKYKRRIDRTYKFIEDADKIIFLYGQQNFSFKYPNRFSTNPEINENIINLKLELNKLINYFNKKYDNKNFEYLILNSNENFEYITKYLLKEIKNNKLINGDITDKTKELFKNYKNSL